MSASQHYHLPQQTTGNCSRAELFVKPQTLLLFRWFLLWLVCKTHLSFSVLEEKRNNTKSSHPKSQNVPAALSHHLSRTRLPSLPWFLICTCPCLLSSDLVMAFIGTHLRGGLSKALWMFLSQLESKTIKQDDKQSEEKNQPSLTEEIKCG